MRDPRLRVDIRLGANVIRISDFASRLERLHVFGAHDYQLDEVFDEVCKRVFGATSDAIPEEEFDHFPELTGGEAIRYAEEQGFDITDAAGQLLRDWESFVLMIQAREAGFLPGGPNDSPELRLRREAERFKRLKDEATAAALRRGKVKWFDAGRGFGFIKPETGADVFLHVSDVRAAGLEDVRAGERLQFEVQEDGRGRAKAINIRPVG